MAGATGILIRWLSGVAERRGDAGRPDRASFAAANFCPPTEEGVTIALVDEKGERVELEFLGLVLKGESSFGFFFPIDDEHPATSSGEVVVLEVTEVDEEGQPVSFELVDDEVIAAEAYADFQVAAKDLYDFA